MAPLEELPARRLDCARSLVPRQRGPADAAAIQADDQLVEALCRGRHPSRAARPGPSSRDDDLLVHMLAAWCNESRTPRR